MSSIFSKRSEKGENYIKGKYGVDVPKCESLNSCTDFLFSIYDKVCEEYNPPFVSKNMQVAVRTLKDSLKGQNGLLNMHPDDYCLVHIGYFDKDTGSISSCTIFEKYELSNMFTTVKDIKKEVDNGVQE